MTRALMLFVLLAGCVPGAREQHASVDLGADAAHASIDLETPADAAKQPAADLAHAAAADLASSSSPDLAIAAGELGGPCEQLATTDPISDCQEGYCPFGYCNDNGSTERGICVMHAGVATCQPCGGDGTWCCHHAPYPACMNSYETCELTSLCGVK